MTATPDQIRDDIERTRKGLSADVDQLADAVDPRQIAHRQTEKVKDAVVGVKERVMGSDSEDGIVQDAAGAPARAAGWARERTAGSPWAAGLIALGVGWMIGSLLPATKPEQDAAERIVETAKTEMSGTVGDAASQLAEHLQEPVAEAVEAVKDRATDAAATVKDSVTTSGDDAGSGPSSARAAEPMPGG